MQKGTGGKIKKNVANAYIQLVHKFDLEPSTRNNFIILGEIASSLICKERRKNAKFEALHFQPNNLHAREVLNSYPKITLYPSALLLVIQ